MEPLPTEQAGGAACRRCVVRAIKVDGANPPLQNAQGWGTRRNDSRKKPIMADWGISGGFFVAALLGMTTGFSRVQDHGEFDC
jgi:hypothetical protein